MAHIPEHTAPIWVDGKLTNGGGLPLWSGKGPVPEVGDIVGIIGPQKDVATVLDYRVDGNWLMLWCQRHRDGVRGDLAGSEIRKD